MPARVAAADHSCKVGQNTAYAYGALLREVAVVTEAETFTEGFRLRLSADPPFAHP